MSNSTAIPSGSAVGQQRELLLFIAQRINGIELGGTRSRIKSSDKADKHRKSQRTEYQPPRNRREFDGIQILPLKINVRSKRNGATQQPAEKHSENSSKESHHPRFHEKQLLYIGIRCTERLQHANFAAALQNCHHQGIHNPQRGDRERKTSEDSEEKIEHREKCA